MTVRTKIAGVCAASALVASFGILPAVSAEAAPNPPQAPQAQPVAASQPVTGTLPDGTEFTGALSDLRVERLSDGTLQLVGTITGTGLPAGGTTFTAPIEGITTDAPVCEVLSLDLGPLDLDLLGLVIELNQVELDITAVPGAGNLRGGGPAGRQQPSWRPCRAAEPSAPWVGTGRLTDSHPSGHPFGPCRVARSARQGLLPRVAGRQVSRRETTVQCCEKPRVVAPIR